jgi:hypothetical protein
VARARIDSAVLDYFVAVNVDIGRMVEERRHARDSRLADLARRIDNARREQAVALRRIDTLDLRLSEGLATEDYERAMFGPRSALAAATGALDDLSREQSEVQLEPDLGDAEHDVLEQLAAVAGEIGGAADIAAAQAAIRRVFSHFVLRPIDRAWMENPPAAEGEVVLADHPGADAAAPAEYELLPVVRADGIALTTLNPALQAKSGMSASLS